MARLWSDALERLHLGKPPVVKGVKGLTSPGKVPEAIEKGILRASHAISVYQDGTARFDLTDLPLTHFRPAEIGTDIATLRRLGYTRDWSGAPLTDDEQLVELLPQDLVVARSCGTYLTRLAQFVDDELVRLYDGEPSYRAERPEQLIGQIVVALAPHTSGGVAGRLLGFTNAEACFAHPVFHAAKRRNCDGDEDSVTLLLDALLNFSRSYLPDSRGALMDKPLVLTTRLEATEVDKEAHNVDVSSHYPLAFYRATMERRDPKEVEPLLDLVGHRLGSSRSLSGYGFTHDTHRIAGGPPRSAYREGRSMADLVERSIGTSRADPRGRPRRGGHARAERPLPSRRHGKPEELRDPEVPVQGVRPFLSPTPALGSVRRATFRGPVRRRAPLHGLRGVGAQVPPALSTPRGDGGDHPVRPTTHPAPRRLGRHPLPGGRCPDDARPIPSGFRGPRDRRGRPSRLPRPRRTGRPERPNSRRPVEGRRACGVAWTILLAFEASDLGSKSRSSTAAKLPASPSPAVVAG